MVTISRSRRPAGPAWRRTRPARQHAVKYQQQGASGEHHAETRLCTLREVWSMAERRASRRNPNIKDSASSPAGLCRLCRQLYHAPLMNVDAFGRVCTGTADLPASCGIPDIPAWEQVMHDTCYSHVNQNHTLNQTLLHARPLARPRNIVRTHRVTKN
jgi:hypothetical protein